MKEYLLNKAESSKELGHIMLADLFKKWSEIDDIAKLKELAEWHHDKFGNYYFAQFCMRGIISEIKEKMK
jgi:hypothetical protein